MTQPQQPVAYGCYRHPDRPTYIGCQRCGRPICGECMISAAVGFQCADCVAAGARETRSNQLPYGGKLVANPVLTTAVLIGANLAIWLAIPLTGGSTSRWVDVLSLTPVSYTHLDVYKRQYLGNAEWSRSSAPAGFTASFR